ncbi:MAG: F0F1 ATP synthase subunit alpha, partial [Treponema sp.]|nr:F0F1 ATP synthase subunit alpha [Treponema sp.]
MVNYGDLTRVLEEQINEWQGKAFSDTSGFVTSVGDSVAVIYGLRSAVYGELVEFSSGASGIALNLEENSLGCVLLS